MRHVRLVFKDNIMLGTRMLVVDSLTDQPISLIQRFSFSRDATRPCAGASFERFDPELNGLIYEQVWIDNIIVDPGALK